MTPASASGAASPNGSCSAKSIAQCWQSGEITFWPGDGEAMPAADVLVEERRQKKQEAMVIARNGRGKSLQTSRSIAQRLHSDGTSTHTHTHITFQLSTATACSMPTPLPLVLRVAIPAPIDEVSAPKAHQYIRSPIHDRKAQAAAAASSRQTCARCLRWAGKPTPQRPSTLRSFIDAGSVPRCEMRLLGQQTSMADVCGI